MIMMQRRLLAAVAAFLIAAVGAVVLVGYAPSADARAQAGEQLVSVLVVGSTVPAGTEAADVAGSVSTEEVPARLAAPGRVSDLSTVAGFVTTADLLPGEQLLADRFADPASLLPAGTVAAPAGTQEVSLTLQPQQAVDGALKAGDRVGVLVLGSDDSGIPASQSIDGVLVTRSSGATESADPSAQVTVTLALDGEQSATVITGMQQGTIWLSLQEMARPGTTPDSSVAATSSAGAQS
jgi:pilus assembly protein CpaB